MEELEKLIDGFKGEILESGGFIENAEHDYKSLLLIRDNLKNLREKIKENKLKRFSDSELEDFLEEFKIEYKKRDLWEKVSEELEIAEQEQFFKINTITKIFTLKIKIQALISRIANKVHKEQIERTEKNFKREIKKFEQIYEEVKEENKSSKESILTISSLIFTAFTLIQLNFSAFQNSKDYLVLDRIILFSGINLFLILGVYCILSMIKSFFNIKTFKEREIDLSGGMIIVSFIIFSIFSICLYLKGKTENYEKENNIIIKKIEEENRELKKRVENEINNLELQIINYKKENSLLENEFLKYKEDINKKK